MDITTFRKKFSPLLDQAVSKHIEEYASIAQDPFLASIANHVFPLVTGGKLLRPYLVTLGYAAGDGSDQSLAMKLGVALELFHAFCLIHDDIIDLAETRRNLPTIETFTGTQLRAASRRGDLAHLASSQAILLGDLVFSWAARHAMAAALISPEPAAVIEEFYGMVDEVVVGQMIDVDTMSRDEHDEELLERKMYLKTAGYSFIRPLRLGLYLSGNKNPDTAAALTAIGMPMGLAFQLQDDLLDITSDTETLGKPTLADIRAGQQTLLTAYVEKHGTQTERQLLERVMSGQGSDQECFALRDIFLHGGAVAAANLRVTELWAKTTQAIEAADCLGEGRADFHACLELLRSRVR
jgi:geranylgeranyl diphosphate synthase type I